MVAGDADRIYMLSCSSFAGVASKILGELEMMGHFCVLSNYFLKPYFFYGVIGRRDLQGSSATPDDTLEFRLSNATNKISDIIHHF